MRTIHDHELSLFVSAAALSLSAACASGPQASASASAEPGDAQVMATAQTPDSDMSIEETPRDTSDDETSTPDAEPTPEYTSVEVFIDPTLLAACGVKPPKVFFETDSAEVEEVGDNKLDYVAECLNREPLDDEYIEIVGHADPRGTEEYNRELGLDRANSVASLLSNYGVSRERIDTYSLGEQGADDDPDAWRTDRRVVVRLDR